jgi:hypothetical protein
MAGSFPAEKEIEKNFAAVKETIAAACARAGREGKVEILAATKAQPVEKIEAAIKTGVAVCGENYLQEAEKKISEIGSKVQWHFIGHLQSNKAKKAVELFDCIQSVDSIKLARKISNAAAGPFPILIEVNIGREKSKFGVLPEALPELLESIKGLPNLSVIGLMCMAPRLPAEQTRPFFQRMRLLSQQLFLAELSMGMSSDYAVAVEEGSTMVRIGTALFGERK